MVQITPDPMEHSENLLQTVAFEMQKDSTQMADFQCNICYKSYVQKIYIFQLDLHINRADLQFFHLSPQQIQNQSITSYALQGTLRK